MRTLPVGMLLVGCAPWVSGETDGLRTLENASWSTPDGTVTLAFDVEEGDAAFAATFGVADDLLVYVARVRDPSGAEVLTAKDWWEGTHNKTNAVYSAATNTLVWPSSPDDGPLLPGRWEVDAIPSEPQAMSVHLAIKQDAALLEGALDVRVRMARAVAEEPALEAGTREAVRRWTDEIYGPLGIDMTVTFDVWDGAAALGSPGFEDADAYRDASADKPLRTLEVLVLESITDGAGIFGVSGGIPGPLVPSDRSVVAISALEATGAQLAFAEVELDLFAETMAHEVGHYLGLFHPAELPVGGAVRTWDVLVDTPECASFEACATALGGNLMFPTPLCASGESRCTSFVAQRQVTPAQAGALHRNPHVR